MRYVSGTKISRACSSGSTAWDTTRTSWACDGSIPKSTGTASATGLASRIGQPSPSRRHLFEFYDATPSALHREAHPDRAPLAWPNGGWCAVADPGMVREAVKL